jgi:hypothetical protein
MSFGKRLKNTGLGFLKGGIPGAVDGAFRSASSPSNKTLANNNVSLPYSRSQRQGLEIADIGSVDSLKQLHSLTDPKNAYLKQLNDLPDSIDPESYYNNPFRQSTYGVLSDPIKRKYSTDRQQLTDDLNAENQLGGSYAALRLDKLNQNYNEDLNKADNQAIQASADVYQQAINQKQQKAKLLQQYYDTLLNQLSGYQNYTAMLRQQNKK